MTKNVNNTMNQSELEANTHVTGARHWKAHAF